MLDKIRKQLDVAKKERAEAVKPYNDRIKNLSKVIDGLCDFAHNTKLIEEKDNTIITNMLEEK